jgi:putative hydrolase of the HAD superfamily
MIKAVFFDAINTLFLPKPTHEEMYQRVLFEVTGKKIEIEKVKEILSECGQAIEQKALKHKDEKHGFWDDYPIMIAKLVGCSDTECANIGDKIRFETWGNPKNYYISGETVDVLEELLAKNIRIACVSNEDGWLGDFFDHFGLTEYFEFILASENVGVEKPNPKIFNIALEQAELKANEVLFVGDSPISDYFGATNVGMKAVLIDREGKITDDGMVRIKSLNEVLEHIINV